MKVKKSEFRKALKQSPNIKLNKKQGYVTNGLFLIKITQEMVSVIFEVKGDVEDNFDFDDLIKSLASDPKQKNIAIKDTSMLLKNKALLRIYNIKDQYMFANEMFVKLFDSVEHPILESKSTYSPIIISNSAGMFQGIVLPVRMPEVPKYLKMV